MALSRTFKCRRCSEWRRRIVRQALRPLFRAGDARLTPAKALAGAGIRRVLICRPNHRLGNLLLLTPLVMELQRTFPEARVDIVLAGEHGAELFTMFRQVDRVHSLSRRMVRHPVAVIRTMLRIRRARYDLVIDPCEASQSGRLLVAIAGARLVVEIPRGQSMAGMEGSSPAGAVPTHMAQWPVFLLRRALAPSNRQLGNDYPAMDIQLSAAELQGARARLGRALPVEGESRARRIIGVFATATGAKDYGTDWWRCFVRAVGMRHPEAVMVEIVPADGRPRLAPGLPSLGSASPREVAAMIANMTCFVSADCGVMHLASAAGVPTIGLFKASDLPKYAPYGHGSRALDTTGKSPEEVAELVSTVIGTFPVSTDPRDCMHAGATTAIARGAASPGPAGADVRAAGVRL